MTTRVLLICGVLSSVLYIAMNVLVPLRWEGYSSASQTVSELSAIGAPTRPQWVPLGIAYSLLVVAFAFGVWKSSLQNRALRITGSLLFAYGVISLGWPFAPMHLRGEGFTTTDTMHIVLAAATVLLMLVAIGFGAAAFGSWFRRYSITTLVILFSFGALSFRDGPRVAANLPTPWIGVWERINIAAFLLWVIVVAATLLRRRDTLPEKR